VVAAAAAFLLLGAAGRRALRSRLDVVPMLQAMVLRVEEEGRTRTVRAPAPIVIGRAATATLLVTDPQVSRLHARIDFADGTPTIRDLDSRNGTLVNARPIDAPVDLEDGDEIDIGTIRITFCGVGPWK
jgi:pSer/pThr/pTyr-binding forkhead associated (FHA) protein